jgi:hypothetical protein
MSEILPILTGLVVISALAVVASNDKKDDKKDDKKEAKERKEYKPREEKKNKEDDFKKLFGYFKQKLSAKKKPRRYHKVYSKGRTKRNRKGETLYEFRSVSK